MLSLFSQLGNGVAMLGQLSLDLLRFAAQRRIPYVTCEVNERPPNPASMRFHDRFGFAPVGRAATEDGKKDVVYLARRLEVGKNPP